MASKINNRPNVPTAPNFIVIGAAKSGTTTLYDDIATHPRTHMPASKEPDIFHRAQTVEEARELYAYHFSNRSDGQLCGEASTYYTMLPTFNDVTRLALEVCGEDIRLIYLMRDPIRRIISHLSHDYMVGRLRNVDFDTAVRDDPRYVSWSDYPMQAKPWIAAFGLDRILFLSFEEYVANKKTTMERVFEHLGLDPCQADITSGASNQRGSQRQLRISGLGKLLSSRFYQRRVRPLLPRKVLTAAKTILTRKRTLPNVVLSDESIHWLEDKFANQQAELKALGIEAFPGTITHVVEQTSKS